MSLYAHGRRYDPATDTRLDAEPINKDWGLIVHAPVMKGTAQLYWINLKTGRELAHLATTVRTARKAKTMTPVTIEVAPPPWPERIESVQTLAGLREAWIACGKDHGGTVPADLKTLLIDRSKELTT